MLVPTQIDMGLVAAILAALAVLLVVGGGMILQADRATNRRLNAFISSYVGNEVQRELFISPTTTPSLIQRLNRALARGELTAGMRRELMRAGTPLRVSQFIYLRCLTALGLALVAAAVASQGGSVVQLIGAIVGGVGGWLGPMIVIRLMQQRRMAAFEQHLPDAIDIMAGSLEAGSSLPMALDLVAREISPPVSTEFGRALREVSLGMSLDDALLNMLDRIYSEELDLLATAVAIQFRVGGNLADVLRSIAFTIRERVRIRADVRTLTAQQTISANVLSVLPVLLAGVLFILNPAYERRLFEPGFPQLATLSALLMVIAAYFILKRIVSIDM